MNPDKRIVGAAVGIFCVLFLAFLIGLSRGRFSSSPIIKSQPVQKIETQVLPVTTTSTNPDVKPPTVTVTSVENSSVSSQISPTIAISQSSSTTPSSTLSPSTAALLSTPAVLNLASTSAAESSAVTAAINTTVDTNTTNTATTTVVPGVESSLPSVYDFVGYFNADNYLKVSRNGIIVYQGTEDGTANSNKIDWPSKQVVRLSNVQPGEKIGFIVTNVSSAGGFSGEFSWNNKKYLVNSSLFSEYSSTSLKYATPNTNLPANIPHRDASSSPLFTYTTAVWGKDPGSVSYNYPDSEWVWTPGIAGDSLCEFCTNTYVWIAA